MDLMTLSKTNYNLGSIVNNVDSILWVERYLEPGEFKIVCDPTPELMSQLALGTFLSHTETFEVMMVENHEIKETLGQPAKLEVTGRSIECFLEKRIISVAGVTAFNTTTGNANEFTIGASTPQAQVNYILLAFLTGSIFDSANVVPNVSVIIDSSITYSTTTEKSIKKGENLYKVVYETLKSADLGIRFERPLRDKNGTPIHHYDSGTDPNALKMACYIHTGVDRSNTVYFFYDSGEVKDARYFWSNKQELNYIHAATSYAIRTTSNVTPTATAWDNKTGYIDVTEINTKVAGNPTETNRQASVLDQKIAEGFSLNKKIALMEATINPNSRYVYRTDYLVGDLVYVIGNYGMSAKMRVIENVETQDSNGYSSYPTLASI